MKGHGRKEGRNEGQKEGWKEEQKEGWKEIRKEGWKEGRKELHSSKFEETSKEGRQAGKRKEGRK